MTTRFVALSLFAIISFSRLEAAKPQLEPIAPGDFVALHDTIKPQPGESPWREIPWLTDVTEARRRAIAEDKPLLFFTAADGSPVGRT